MKKQEVLFIAVFSAIALISITLLGVSDVFGILLTGCIGGPVAALVVGRRKVYNRESAGKWKSALLCASTSAVIAALILMAKVYTWTVIAGITGSPYDVYQISYLRIFLFTGVLSFISLTAALAIYDHAYVLGLNTTDKN